MFMEFVSNAVYICTSLRVYIRCIPPRSLINNNPVRTIYIGVSVYTYYVDT